MAEKNRRNKVFGIGLAKTGTSSLTIAMQKLGYNCVHYPNEEQWNNMCQFDFACDMPVQTRYTILDIKYPGSKFVLTVRDSLSWIESIERWWNTKSINQLSNRILEKRKEQFGIEHFDRGVFLERHLNHVLDVTKYFRNRSSDLLIMNICGGDGWSVLCPFLEIKTRTDQFPKVNNYDKLRKQ